MNSEMDPMLPPGDDAQPNFENMNRAALLAWEERQRRQRTLRTLMMLLMFLLLMDGEEPPDRRNARSRQQRLRNQQRAGGGGGDSYKMGMYFDDDGNDLTPLSEDVFQRRKDQDEAIRKAVTENQSSKHYDLLKLNHGRDVEAELRDMITTKILIEMEEKEEDTEADTEKDEDATEKETAVAKPLSKTVKKVDGNDTGKQKSSSKSQLEGDDELEVYHYPRNASGYYRGFWKRIPKQFNTTNREEKNLIKLDDHSKASVDMIYPWVQEELDRRKLDACVLVLPPDVYVKVDKETNSTTTDDEDAGDTAKKEPRKSLVSLTKDEGRVALQLYSHIIPAMNEISVVDGLVKMFDSKSVGFVSKQTDVLLRVKGVLIHSIGKMSLVTTFPSENKMEDPSLKRSAFGVRQTGNQKTAFETEREENDPSSAMGKLIDETEKVDGERDEVEQRRRLQATVEEIRDFQQELQRTNPMGMLEMMAQLREDVMSLYPSQYDHGILDKSVEMSSSDLKTQMESAGWTQLTTLDEDGLLEQINEDSVGDHRLGSRRLQSVEVANVTVSSAKENTTINVNPITGNNGDIGEIEIKVTTTPRALALSATPPATMAENHTFPFPYTRDDRFSSVEKATNSYQKLPIRDQFLEENAGNCEFTMDFDVQTTMWTYGDWRKTMDHRLRMEEAFNPRGKKENTAAELLNRLKKDPHFILVNKQVQIMEEDIPQEAFVVTLTGNIESTNCDFASFVNATAIRTNWEKTTAKAINYSFYMMIACLTQIVILLRQLLHTQAHSVASNVSLLCIGWQTILDAMLCISHIFLCLVLQPLFTAFASVAFFKLLIFCVIEMKYMAIIIQARNSVNNTETTQEQLRQQITLLHFKFYASLMLAIMLFWYVGQSFKTLYVMTLYSFWVPQICWNIYSEYKKPMHHHYIYGMSLTRAIAPLYVFAAKNNFLKEVNPDFPTDLPMCELLILWISLQTAILIGQSKFGTRFMIPQRFLPPKFDYGRPIPASLLPRPSSSSSNETASSSDIELDPTSAQGGTRHRRGRGNRGLSDGGESMSEDTGEECTLDCVICYNEIDVTDNKGYMLAPCDHIFHRECLEQWMDVKMECPICRTSLPAL